jgi:hypothetical protein
MKTLHIPTFLKYVRQRKGNHEYDEWGKTGQLETDMLTSGTHE